MSETFFVEQPIPLSTFFTDKDGVVSLVGYTVRYDYWFPGVADGAVKSGYVAGTVVDAATGEASGLIPASVNTTAKNGIWRIQAAVVGSGEYPEVVTRIDVKHRGST